MGEQSAVSKRYIPVIGKQISRLRAYTAQALRRHAVDVWLLATDLFRE